MDDLDTICDGDVEDCERGEFWRSRRRIGKEDEWEEEEEEEDKEEDRPRDRRLVSLRGRTPRRN